MAVFRLAVVGMLLASCLAGCATTPKQTVLSLDTTDRKWSSRRCVEARKEAADYKDYTRAKLALGVGGNLLVPFAGTGAALAWNASQRKSMNRLDRKIVAACVSHPAPGSHVATRPAPRAAAG